MGNTQNVPEEAEDDNTCTVKSYQPLSESPDGVRNGSVVFAQEPPLAVNGEADAKAGAGRDNAAVSSSETPEQSPGGPSAGSAARPRSLLAFPWAVPGRSEEAAAPAAPAAAAGRDQAPSEGTQGPGPAVSHERSHKNLGRAPLQDLGLAGTPEGRDAAAPKPRAVSVFDRIFKLEKGKERTQGDPREGRQGLDVPNGSIAPNGIPLGKASASEIDECKQKEPGQDSAGEQGPAAAAPERAQVEQDSPRAAAAQGSVMSFLKTLVTNTCSKCSPAPAVVHKGSKAEKGPGGQPAPKAAPESPSKGAKKKKAESPKLGHSTFSKLFRHKAAKETPQTTNTKSPEQPAVVCVKAERNVPPTQEPPAKQNPKAPEAVAPPQGAASEPPREGTKDKGSATPLPLSKLFWKKNSSEEAEAVSNEKAEAALEAVAPDRDESKGAETAEVKPRGAESKTPKANLRKFFKLTLNPTEKPLAPSESDPGGQRSREGSKDKKPTLEPGRQKGREAPEPREPPAAEPDSIQNGGDGAKDPSYKKAEKRQSLGGFFKGLGSKRMSDAEVQTDPVSILPAGKSK
ncbi:BCAS1 protein, partial [Notiomystis cincta]|nr:BCAS1 protein [Notiomystis cincta]